MNSATPTPTPTPTPTSNITAINTEEFFIEGIIFTVFGVLLFLIYYYFITIIFYSPNHTTDSAFNQFLRSLERKDFAGKLYYFTPFIIAIFMTALGILLILESTTDIQKYIYIEKQNAINVKLLMQGAFFSAFAVILFLVSLFILNKTLTPKAVAPTEQNPNPEPVPLSPKKKFFGILISLIIFFLSILLGYVASIDIRDSI